VENRISIWYNIYDESREAQILGPEKPSSINLLG
jgi:hypothetical protein